MKKRRTWTVPFSFVQDWAAWQSSLHRREPIFVDLGWIRNSLRAFVSGGDDT